MSSDGQGGHVPYNLDAERGVLASLLCDPSWFDPVLEILRPADFWRDSHQCLYRVLTDLYRRGAATDAVAVMEEIESRNWSERCGGMDYLAEVAASAASAANAVYHAGLVREKARSRAILLELQEAQRQVLANGRPAADLLAGAIENLARIEEQTPADAELLRSVRPWPPPLGEAAYHGLTGELVRLIEPHSEADPAAILFQFLAAAGNLLGRRPHWRVESTRHSLNLFVCLAGKTSKARKGTSFDHIRWLMERLDEEWARCRFGHGFASGEGLIADVADDSVSNGQITPGATDKRLFWVESEFGGALTIMSRDGNTLSSVTRQAWDGGILSGRSKHRPLRATGAHISIVGHITVIEANDLLSTTNAANGFGNRFLWVCCERSKLLPHGGQIHRVNWEPLLEELRLVKDWVLLMDPDIPIHRHRDASELWEQVYPSLSEGRPGILGAVTSRAEAQVMRLAALYAILDRSNWIYVQHMRAALECWRYAEESARYIFGDRLGDPDAERALAAIAPAGEDGLSRTQINRVGFSGKLSAAALDQCLASLIRASLIEPVEAAKDRLGRQVTRWRCKHSCTATSVQDSKEVARLARSPLLEAQVEARKPF